MKRLGQRTTQDVGDQYAREASARARVRDVTARRPSADRELAAGAKVGSHVLQGTSSVFVYCDMICQRAILTFKLIPV